MTDPARPRVYLAGPEVFLPDALEVLKEKADLARAAGFEPVTPLDNESLPTGSPFDQGLAIYRANVRLMNSCDLIIANLTPFRGVGADPGTAFEVGYMAARGARIAAYTNRAMPHFERIRDEHYQGQITQDPAGEYRGPDGLALENFDMFDNLMLAGAIADGRGILVTHEVEDSRRLYRDLTAFRRCLASLQGTEEQPARTRTAE
ncbi:nucleoside 2-deoxyribosyltransferase [Paracoccus niistensis]|uniref:Nucleoside 2-deoxyribosyltransferase n=1 Tax=Paracoccus niistensis TaxID=632935 RepID=A0ABV6I3M8_9RHOB